MNLAPDIAKSVTGNKEYSMGAYQKYVSYNGPVEIQEDLTKKYECKTHTAIHIGKEGSGEQKWRTDEKPYGTYQGIYARVPRS